MTIFIQAAMQPAPSGAANNSPAHYIATVGKDILCPPRAQCPTTVLTFTHLHIHKHKQPSGAAALPNQTHSVVIAG